MSSSSVLPLLSTSISLAVTLTTYFSTIYQTSTPVIVNTLTSVSRQLSTLTQPEIVMTSTIAFPTTITQTMTQVFTSSPPAPAPSTSVSPSISTAFITTTITSTIVQAGQTVTYYPPAAPTTSFVLTPVYTLPEPATSTIALTEVIFLLQNGGGQVYSTITTILPFPNNPTYTSPIVFVPEPEGHGWDTWSDAQKGGLISGIILAFLIMLGILLFCLLRRRTIWWATDYPVVQQQQQIGCPLNHAYWGPGPAGWGIRGGGGGEGRENWWKSVSKKMSLKR